MQIFGLSVFVTIVGLGLAFWWGSNPASVVGGPWAALMIAVILSIMEVSLSFDNAVVNASVLQTMSEKWQRRFLTWGMLIAVFGMRLIFPIVIVAVVAHLGVFEVVRLALQNPAEYAHHLEQSHVSISAFGGMFLLMVFLNFLIDKEKDVHWLAFVERRLAAIGKVESIQVILAVGTLMVAQSVLPQSARLEAMMAGMAGVLLYLLVDGLAALTGRPEAEGEPHIGEAVGETVKRSGVMAFLYLEVLDASFSLDGVIGAFAITKDVVIISVGLMIGAMFVRSMTIYLVRKGTLKQFIFLEHGAHYGIGTLAVLMLISMNMHVSELLTGLMGVAFIIASLISSVLHKRLEERNAALGEPTTSSN